MGNDGGSIPTRRELVKSPTRQKTTSELRSQSSQNAEYHWSFCPLSKRPLASPVVSDALGRLFNKDAVIEWLLSPWRFGDGEEVMKASGFKGLKDVVDVKFEIAEEGEEDGNGGDRVVNGGIMNANGKSGRTEVWVCPVTRKELGAGTHTVYLVPCGHAFAEAAVKEIKEDTCLTCTGKFDKTNGIVKINPTEEKDIEFLKQRKEALLAAGLTHSLKKISTKKRKGKGKDGDDKDGEKKKDGEKTKKEEPKEKTKPSTASDIASKVLGDVEQRAKRRRLEMSENVKSLFTNDKDENGKKAKDSDFMTRGYSMPAKGRK